MSDTYLTVLFSDGWTCPCPSPFIPAPSERMSAADALIEADNHVSYYQGIWPHGFIEGER